MTWLFLAAVVLLAPIPGRIRTGVGGSDGSRAGTRQLRLDWSAAAAAAGLTAFLLPLPWAVPSALVAGATAWRLVPRHAAPQGGAEQLALARALPDTLHLLAALIRAGCTDQDAVARAARAAGEPLSGLLADVARMRGLGATAAEAWGLADDEQMLGPLAAVMTRRSETGAGVAAELDRLGADARSDFHSRAQVAARAAAVRSVLPLAACFLPSFFLLGVVPIVAAFGAGLQF